ncbi:MAG: CehA/McbA family metallohydrolase [Clostridiaceae bacterium]|nr:CehA/McbA family metallohydrolase [Clostridiaceae bacterium]
MESGKVHLDSTDLELVRDLGWAKDQIVGLRFQNIDIPKDATVKNAYIQFTAKEAGSNSPSLVIKAQASDNAEGFNNTKYNISSRAVTAASVSWNPPVWSNVNESGINQRTPDLANLLQEVVNRSNWTRGNSMAFIISGLRGNNICAYSFKGSNTYAPVLHVEYILPNPGPSTTPGSEYNVYFGTLHNHSTVSDGKGTPAEAYAYARDVGFLDFFALSDHSDAISAEEWAETKNIADSFNQDGVFTTFRGFEWSSGTHGHVTIINTDDYCGTVDSSTNTFPEISSWIASRDCAAFLNHPGRENGEGKEFSHLTTTPNNNFVGMELWNKRDNFSVYYYNDGYYTDDGNMGYFDEALLRKWRIGAGGGDDNHNANWGTHNNHRLAVLAKANTRAEIYNALKERRFYSTLDKNLRLSFEVNGYQMGSFINPGTYNAVIKASDDNQEIFTRVEMIKNGVVVNTWTPNMENPVITQSISTTSGDYYYIRVRQSDGNEAVSSPVFIN